MHGFSGLQGKIQTYQTTERRGAIRKVASPAGACESRFLRFAIGMTTLSNLRIIVRYRGVLRESPENQGVNHDGEQKTNIVHFCPPWHGGPDLGKQEEVWSRKDLDEMQHNLSQRAWRQGVLSEGVSRVRHHQFAHVSASSGDSGVDADMETVAEVAALGHSARIRTLKSLNRELPSPQRGSVGLGFAAIIK